jgi:cell shape-determining protein MreC
MNYLQDKKSKRKYLYLLVFLIVLVVIIFYFSTSIFNKSSLASHAIFRPVLILGDRLGERFASLEFYFASKNSLQKDNDEMKRQLEETKAQMANYDSVVAENNTFKEILGRKGTKEIVVAGILSKPNQSPYDTFIIDAGSANGIKLGKTVFAGGDVPLGRVGEVFANSAKVVMFSSPGERTQVAVGTIFLELLGRGGGNFEMIVPRDFTIQNGDQAILPGVNAYLVGVVRTIISDPRDAFKKALLASPVNIFELKFVEVEK